MTSVEPGRQSRAPAAHGAQAAAATLQVDPLPQA
jgi:hypothetical protein